MATVTDSIANIILEDIAPGVRDGLIEEDAIFADIIEDAKSAYQDNIGRDWKVLQTFVTSLAGSLKAFSSAEGPDIAYSGVATTWASGPRTFQPINEIVAPGYTQREITLKEWWGNMAIPLVLIRASRLTTAVTDAVAMLVKQTARMVAHVKAVMFISEDSNRTICAIGNVDSGGSDSDATVTFDVDGTNGAGRIRRLQPGMLVDIYDSDGDPRRNEGKGPIIIKSVDPLTATVVADLVDQGETFATGVETGDIIVLRDSKAAGPSNLGTWIANSGSILGMSTTTYPQLKSYVYNYGSATDPTDAVLREHLGKYLDAYGKDKMIDTIITTEGVLANWIGELDDSRRVMVDTSPDPRVGGFGGPGHKFAYDGRYVRIRTSSLVNSGTLWGLKLKNNIKHYTPPRLPDTTEGRYFNGDIEFVAPQFGLRNIWMPTTYNDGITEYAQAPFVSVEEYAPEQVQGMKITNLQEWTAAA